MRVLVLIETGAFSGPARNLLETLSLLRDRAEFVIGTFVRGGAESDFSARVRDLGFEVRVIREAFRYDPRCIPALARVVRDARPDLLQIHNTKSRLYAWLVARVSRTVRAIPQIQYFHGETWVDPKQEAYNALDRRLFSRARNLIAVSRRQKALLVEWGARPERIAVVHNAIRPVPPAQKVAGDRKRILYAGRFSREKGVMLLVEAAERLSREGVTGFELVLLGDGPERSAVRARVEAAGLADIVRLEGFQANIEPYYRAADLFVLPSFTEGLPNVLLEAAAYEVPIVAFKVGGIPEMFTAGQEAVLLERPDAADLAAAIRRFIEDPSSFRRMASAARRRVERDFSVEAKAERLLACYRQVVTGRPLGELPDAAGAVSGNGSR